MALSHMVEYMCSGLHSFLALEPLACSKATTLTLVQVYQDASGVAVL